MKKSNLTLVFCMTVFFLSAQDYLITFSGSGENTTVSNVIVENMTQGKSLTLNGNDTLHLKSTVTEISDLEYNRTDGIQSR
jgi:D-arabinose 5-phosphate isomerase GutQ